MSITTDGNQVRLPVVLGISIALQVLMVALFWHSDGLRRSVLSTTANDVREKDELAQERLQKLKRERRERQEKRDLPQRDVDALARDAEKKRRSEIRQDLADLQTIRDELKEIQEIKQQEVKDRTSADISLYFHDQLYPLTTQLVAHASQQEATSDLPAAPSVTEAAATFHQQVMQAPESLVTPEGLRQVQDKHAATRANQHQYIDQLDQAQTAYPDDQDRIRQENHTEYLVNLARDQISDILRQMAAFPVTDMNQPPDGFPQSTDVDGLAPAPGDSETLSALHARAAALHQEIQELYGAARAAELAMRQPASLADAWQQVHLPPAASQALSAGVAPPAGNTLADLHAYQDRLDQRARQVHEWRRRAQTIGSAARAMVAGEPAAGGGSPGGSHARRTSMLANAAQGSYGRYVDVSPFMRNTTGQPTSYGAFAGGRDKTEGSKRIGFQGKSDERLAAPEPARLSEEQVLKEALPGRMFTRESPRTGWLYIDTWYMIGPWDNDWKTGFGQPLPPETLVDLDAEYVGKGGQPLRWQFHQSDNIRIKPPAETEGASYYGYTEVYFEEGTEMLVAVASDDAAKVWINDVVIWQDRGFSPWRIDEGFRKVYFREGFNTILLRIENGPVTCTYSLLLCPPERGT